MKEVRVEGGGDDEEPHVNHDAAVVHFENRVWIIRQSVRIPSRESLREGVEGLASKVLLHRVGIMETRTGFFQLVSAVVGLSLGVSVMTATVLLGVAALLQ